MTQPITDDLSEQMAAYDNVKIRAEGVIGRWLRATFGEEALYGTELDLARNLIEVMNAAGLRTFIGDDLNTYLDDLVKSARYARRQY